MRRSLLFPLLLSPAIACGNDAEGDHELGTVDFGVSCGAEVQGDFDRAVALMHHMMYVESRAAFEDIAERAPSCAMAHWGIAMTLFQPLWPSRPGPEDLRRGEDSVRRAKELEPATDRERALVSAAEAFYREPESADWWTRIRRWADAMDEAFTPRQDDIETGALYALSQLAVGPVSDNRMLHQARAAEVLLGIHDREPQHPVPFTTRSTRTTCGAARTSRWISSGATTTSRRVCRMRCICRRTSSCVLVSGRA